MSERMQLQAAEDLKRAVQALAQPAQIQIELFPSFVVVGDELALDFDEALNRFLSWSSANLSDRQLVALKHLDAELGRWSGPGNEDFWLNQDALSTDARWHEIRDVAAYVLAAMAWPLERPGPSGAVYIPGAPE